MLSIFYELKREHTIVNNLKTKFKCKSKNFFISRSFGFERDLFYRVVPLSPSFSSPPALTSRPTVLNKP